MSVCLGVFLYSLFMSFTFFNPFVLMLNQTYDRCIYNHHLKPYNWHSSHWQRRLGLTTVCAFKPHLYYKSKDIKHLKISGEYYHNTFQKGCTRPASPSLYNNVFCKFCIVTLVISEMLNVFFFLFFPRHVIFLDCLLFIWFDLSFKLFWTGVPILSFFTWRQHHLQCNVNERIIPGSPYFSSWFLKVLTLK